jgi:hypothetical protein
VKVAEVQGKEHVMTKLERADLYRDYLAREGFHPSSDGDGDIVFKAEGKTYIIILDEDDEAFFRLVCPNFWSIDDERERAHVLQASAHATLRTKVAKVFPIADDTWAAVEMFTSPPASVLPVLSRSIMALQVAMQHFRSKMQELGAAA